jgi:acyl-CoA thioesterase FadM
MARITIDLPEKMFFSTQVPVRIDDINYGGHLGNDSLLSIIHEARLRCLKQFGYTELNIEGFGIIMTDSAIVYSSEGFHGDILNIDIGVGDFSKYGCDFVYLVTNRDTDKEVARAKTGIVFFDYEKRKVVRIPEKFQSRFNE